MLTIWGRNNSNNVKKVLWCAEEIGLAYESIPAGGSFGLTTDPAYRAMNPNGLVPTIRDGDFVLWESNAIVRYLAGRYAPGVLSPEDPQARASADRWMDFATSSVAAPFRDLFWGMVRTAPDKRDLAAIEAGRAKFATLLAIADRTLAEQPFLSGDSFGMGDIPLGCFTYAWFEMPIERPDLPHLATWYERLKQRPAYQKTVMIGLS
ncbi:glutathione S-transferase family protein [Kaistia nematophila]|uniref:Glutathione S-transferase n=1 Tax=Kaistia nematophila TaxID=2994654 RepID=A0A9X3IM45_9HYPH|nr:glutathione S-transferase [Kaistia nematophila]MCX5570542.1 glutathione S-transferase [Kaistia nematophila]